MKMNGAGGPPIPKQILNLDPPGNGVATATITTPITPVNTKSTTLDERLAERRRSFVPMSSMEEENLRERLHLSQLKQCEEIVRSEQKYTRDTFRRLFQTKVGLGWDEDKHLMSSLLRFTVKHCKLNVS